MRIRVMIWRESDKAICPKFEIVTVEDVFSFHGILHHRRHESGPALGVFVEIEPYSKRVVPSESLVICGRYTSNE